MDAVEAPASRSRDGDVDSSRARVPAGIFSGITSRPGAVTTNRRRSSSQIWPTGRRLRSSSCPHGTGSVQLFVYAQEEIHFFTIQDDETYRQDLERLAILDAVINNADRKAGHCLIDHDGRLWAIDNALTFHVQPKLRTVIWDFAGLPVSGAILADLRQMEKALAHDAPLSRALEQLLSGPEVHALRSRLGHLVEAGCFPEPGAGRAVPWPLI